MTPAHAAAVKNIKNAAVETRKHKAPGCNEKLCPGVF